MKTYLIISIRVLAALLVSVVIFQGSAAPAEERILDYHSDITIHEDASMTVRETIRVRAEGEKIKRGIYRDFPTDYKDANGKRIRVGFEVHSVQRDGANEPYHTEVRNNGVRVKAGLKDVLLEPGEYTYELTYKTTWQLGFFDDHDELYWNVTGNGWGFEIDRAAATVHLPGRIDPSAIVVEGYTGPKGSKEKHLTATANARSTAEFETTRPLGKMHGLTIVVGFPKGIVAGPTRSESIARIAETNLHVVVAAFGLGLVAIYFMLAWMRYGIDPPTGAIRVTEEPPAIRPGEAKKLSPAAARYIRRMGFDNCGFVATLISMAVKGYLGIEHEDDAYVLRRETKDTEGLDRVEKSIAGHLFKKKKDEIKVDEKNHKRFVKSKEALEKHLKKNFGDAYFKLNTKPFAIGLLISLAFGGLAVAVSPVSPKAPALFLCFWLSFWTVAVVGLGAMVWTAWQAVRSGGGKVRSALFISLFSLPFFIGEVVVFGILVRMLPTQVMIAIVVMAVLNAVFYHLMKAPTVMGRQVMDEIEGFVRYLKGEGRSSFAAMDDKAAAKVFNEYLPYAIALGVEDDWSGQLERQLGDVTELSGEHYPTWYHDHQLHHHGFGALASGVGGALSGAISSASTAPGSSSGFSGGGGGGGSSGGGGGGGGGGGW